MHSYTDDIPPKKAEWIDTTRETFCQAFNGPLTMRDARCQPWVEEKEASMSVCSSMEPIPCPVIKGVPNEAMRNLWIYSITKLSYSFSHRSSGRARRASRKIVEISNWFPTHFGFHPIRVKWSTFACS